MKNIYVSDIPRLFTALTEWCACVMLIQKYPKRFHGMKLWGCLLAALAVQCLFLYSTDSLYLFLWLPCIFIAATMMFLFLLASCNLPLNGIVYLTIQAFLLAEFVASLEWQLYVYILEIFGQSEAAGRHDLFPSILLTVTCLGSYFAIYFFLFHKEEPLAVLNFNSKELGAPLLLGICCFLMSNLSFVYNTLPFTASTHSGIRNIRTLIDLSGVAMLYAYHLQRKGLYVQRELDAIQNVLQNQYVQYRQFRESASIIDRKHHDLKHQIAMLRKELDPDRRNACLDGMEAEIREYEAQNKTGNSVLDTVLTDKSLYCVRHKIELTRVVDGARLSFMDVMDICSIFGNALDNAIECELRLQDKEKRLIHLTVYAKNNLLAIQCKNYCEEKLEIREGIPVTTKADSTYHGYGIKSIKCTAEKYGGTITISNQNNWFNLTILIPIPEL